MRISDWSSDVCSSDLYFANNNARHFAFDADERFLPIYQFAAEDNKKINHLDDFADRFLAKCMLGQMISKYMVLIATEQKLLMMRPYQIYAVKAIVDCIEQNCGNGYRSEEHTSELQSLMRSSYAVFCL